MLSAFVGAARARDAIAAANGALASLPVDTVTKEEAFARMDQAVSQQHVDSYFAVGSAIAKALTSTQDALSTLLGSCASDGSGADACVDSFISRFGVRALRRPLSADDVSFYRGVYASAGRIDGSALADVITVMLNAPEMLYRVEASGTPSADSSRVLELAGHEIAARLAYQFWDGPPDDELLARAQDGSLETDDGLRAALDHVIGDPRAQRTLEVFVREWFALDGMRALDSLVGNPVFDAFVGNDVPSPDLKDDMIDDVLESIRYHAFVEPGSFADWFTSPYSFAKSEELARIYGVSPWNGQGTPPEFREGERAGLITRAALLATGSANTRPIMKGVFIRTHLLCDQIAPPPNNAAAKPPELSANLTTREVVEKLTQQKGSSCAGCHSVQINALGFATENYDALGRLRDKQRLFADDGTLEMEKPVDTRGIPRVWLDDSEPVAGASDLTTRILDSGKAEACFARQYARFALGRLEDETQDGCLLEDVRSSLTDGERLLDAWRRFALRPEFRRRMLPEDS